MKAFYEKKNLERKVKTVGSHTHLEKAEIAKWEQECQNAVD